jgi:hypothetical protein
MKLFPRDDTTPRARALWAKSIDLLLEELTQPPSVLWSARPLYRRDVAAACVHSLTEIRWVLIDDTAAVKSSAMKRLRVFLTDGARSPFYGDNAELARRTAREIAVAFVVPAHAHPAKSDGASRRRAPNSYARA